MLLKAYQLNPLTEQVIHLDFIKVSMKEKIAVEIPVEVKGEPMGVKSGGSLEHVLWNIRVECLPKDIPENIIVDVTELDIADSIHVGELQVPPGVKVLRRSLFIGMTVRISGILCTFRWPDITFGSPAGIILGCATLSRWMTLPIAGTGTPVLNESPNEFTMD